MCNHATEEGDEYCDTQRMLHFCRHKKDWNWMCSEGKNEKVLESVIVEKREREYLYSVHGGDSRRESRE